LVRAGDGLRFPGTNVTQAVFQGADLTEPLPFSRLSERLTALASIWSRRGSWAGPIRRNGHLTGQSLDYQESAHVTP
jgi:hypothetical protein